MEERVSVIPWDKIGRIAERVVWPFYYMVRGSAYFDSETVSRMGSPWIETTGTL